MRYTKPNELKYLGLKYFKFSFDVGFVFLV